MVRFRNFSANVRVEGKDLSCFQTEYDKDSKIATCWIPSKAGQEYSISLTQEADVCPGGYINVRGYFDGEAARKLGASYSSKTHQHHEETGARVSPSEERPFVFENIAVTDKDSEVTGHAVSPDVGTIKLQEMGCHLTQLGPIRTAPVRRSHTSIPYQPSDTAPWVTFIFKYRPAAILEATGIILREESLELRSPSPEPVEREKLNDEQERENKAEILRLEEERIALEQKLTTINARTQTLSSHAHGHAMKQEHGVKQEQGSSRRCFKPGEIIDLTLDDD
ncbi:hypothetical protein FRB95_007931 [Tulasnella sp. JGI-2019a]|nr:hypothetical protein FRB95_007931 [Tulasnella sp. JGI-2019a]